MCLIMIERINRIDVHDLTLVASHNTIPHVVIVEKRIAMKIEHKNGEKTSKWCKETTK